MANRLRSVSSDDFAQRHFDSRDSQLCEVAGVLSSHVRPSVSHDDFALKSTEFPDTQLCDRVGILRSSAWPFRANALRVCACQKLRFHVPDGNPNRESLRRIILGVDESHNIPLPDALLARIWDALPPNPPRRPRDRHAEDRRMQRLQAMPSNCRNLVSTLLITKSRCLNVRGNVLFRRGKPIAGLESNQFILLATHENGVYHECFINGMTSADSETMSGADEWRL